MAPDERELELRRRLDAYVARQAARAAAYDRLTAAGAGDERAGQPAVDLAEPVVASAPPRHARGARNVTVVVPIHDAPEELWSCLWALARNTTREARLLLIDDASTDPRVDDLLAWAGSLENVRVLRNVQNLGFAATVNRALRASDGDVVLLNSDAEVGPRWLEQLAAAACTDPSTGTATPIADNAGAFSAPQIDVANQIPVRLSADDAARLVAAEARGVRPRAPTGNGFCLYLRRGLIDAVGEMDAVSFPRGYGEETDYCMRAGRLGWEHVVDDRTFIHHRRAASFGATKPALVSAARERMAELHPDYKAKVAEFVADEAMNTVRSRVGTALARGEREGSPRTRLLFVVHEGGGGAVATNRDLMGALGGEFACFCFSSDRHVLRLRRIEGSSSDVLHEWHLERPLLLGDISRADYRAAFSAALDLVMPELVHIRHLFKHTLDAPRLTGARELPTVISIHDHYFICPTIHLLDERGRYCGGRCTPGAGACPTVRAGSLPPLKHAFVYQWREEIDAAFADVDAFVTSSHYSREIHRRFVSATRGRPFELIEHGRDLTQRNGLSPAPEPGGLIRILIPGHLDRHKGADLLAAMFRLDRERRLELHFLGDVPEQYRSLGVIHGAYERDDLAARVQEIQPAFVGVFSITGESYSHAITEAWAAGVPVIATDLGAQSARVREHGGGFVVSSTDPAEALAQVIAAADDGPGYARERDRADVAALPSVEEMASQYADLYREVIDRRRPFAAPAQRAASPLSRGVWRLDAVCAPESLAARYLTHPGVQWKLRASVRSASDAPRPTADLVLVSPEAVNVDQARTLVQQLHSRATPLAMLGDRAPAEDAVTDGAREVLLDAASLVIVPSAELARVYSRRHGQVAIVSPVLDERLFLDGAADGPPTDLTRAGDQPVRLVYLDSGSRSGELELLRAVVGQLASAGTRQYELEIASSNDLAPDPSWFRLVKLPDPELAYAEYAGKLRELRARWQIGLVPRLAPNVGDLRYLECAALGLPGVYSATEGDRAIRDEAQGLVCTNDVAAWCDAITRLATDDVLAQTLRAGAWDDVTQDRLMRQSAWELLNALGRALPAPAPETSPQHAG